MIGKRNQVPAKRNDIQSEKNTSGFWGKSSPWQIWSVPAGVDDHDQLVPLRAVSHRQLDLTQWEVTGTRTAAETHMRGCQTIRRHTHACTHARTDKQFDQLYLLVQLLEAELQLLSGVGVGDVRGNAGRRLFIPRQVRLRAGDGQVGGAPPVLCQVGADSSAALTQVCRH